MQRCGTLHDDFGKLADYTCTPRIEAARCLKMLWLGRTCHIKVSTKKAVVLQQLLLSKYHEYFSQKKRIISSDDQPYFSEKLARMKRKKCRGYSRNRKSLKRKNLNAIHVEELSKAKRNFYKRKIKNLKTSNPNNGIEHQCGRIFEILWELNFPVNNFARDNGKIAPSSTQYITF